MNSRLIKLSATAALLFAFTSALPCGAQTISPEQLALNAKLRAMKQHLIMNTAQQKILRGRMAVHPGRKLPKGFRLYPSRSGEGGALATPRESQSPTGAPEYQAAPFVSAFGVNKRANNPAGDVFTDAGQSETSIAAIGSNVLLTWNDGDGFDRVAPNYQLLGFGYSTDGGATWTDGGQMPQLTGNPNWQWSSDPVLTVNTTTSEFIFVGLVFPAGPPGTGTTNGVAIVKGTFSGGVFTWGTPTLIVSGSNSAVFYDKEWVAVDPATSNIYLTYTKFTLSGDEIDFQRSTNGGTVWSAAIKLSSTADNGYVQGARVAVGPTGQVYDVYQAIGPVDKDFFKMRKSVNAGVSFGAEVQAADYFANFSAGAPGFNRERGITYPGMAIDLTSGPDRGRVYLTWNECINYYQSDLSGGAGNISEPENPASFGLNDSPATADLFTLGNTVRGTIGDVTNDFDFFKFTATQGQTCVFFVDSLSATLDMAFRLFCSDQSTRLAISSPGVGYQNLIVWTCPANGTYYIRPAAWDTSDPVTHGYRIRTSIHAPIGSDRARDHRDIFVSSSTDGLTWPTSGTGAPARANDDPAWFDNWLPEVAVTGNSRVFCTWFDWRDAGPTRCGGESNLYLYRSDNTGTTWSNLGLITDATSSWTTVLSNVAPNQGDYIALFANFTAVYPAWGDGRDGNPNVYTIAIPTTTPTLASLASSRVETGRVELHWLAAEYLDQVARLERREGDGGWAPIAQDVVDGNGRVSFVDAAVVAGGRYAYRLAFDSGGATTYSRETEVTIPAGAVFALLTPRPNPVVRDLWLSLSLPSAAHATLSLVDVAGRVVRSRDVGALGAGEHRVNLAEGDALAAGVYVVVLRQGDRVATRRVSVVR